MIRGNKMDLQSLTTAERISLAEALWDSVVAEETDIALTEEQRAELEARLSSYEIDLDDGSTWEDVKANILNNA